MSQMSHEKKGTFSTCVSDGNRCPRRRRNASISEFISTEMHRPGKLGRPQKYIDPDQVYKMSSYGLSTAEIADVLACDPSTISRRFAGELNRARAACKISLRMAMWKRAMAGSDRMLIHLGKVVLRQDDRGRGERPTFFVHDTEGATQCNRSRQPATK
jgi:AraC-like DNA-binding protein